ncbi:hypothetical protein D3C79_788640 [compost metagenome]
MISIEQPQAQRTQHAAAGVIGRTAADGQDDPPGTGIQCRADQLAGAEGAAAARIALIEAKQLQAAGGGHFDDRRVALGQPAPARLHRLTQRPAHLQAAQLASTGGNDGLHAALTAVGHRALDQLRLRQYLGNTCGNGRSHTFSAEAVLERVGGDDDFHGGLLIQMPAC